MIKDFEQRRQQETMNLLFSYTVQEDHTASLHGYKFLGAGYDDKGNEVHVFELKQLPPNSKLSGRAKTPTE